MMDNNLITVDLSKCVGCSSCIRVCPVSGANFSHLTGDHRLVVELNGKRCIKCGECVRACAHGARSYVDDTERFWQALQAHEDMTVIVAPAVRTAFGPQWPRLLQWIREKGVRRIYDVGLGADICTWAHLKLLKKERKKLISQPCAAITNYILKFKPDLIPALSPIHSPMLCLASYLRKYEHVGGKIYALSPCIAKKEEFSATGLIDYNVTFSRLREKLEENHVSLSQVALSSDGNQFDFTGGQGGDGTLYPMPGGLRENLLLHEPALNVLNSEGANKVYKNLDEYEKARKDTLPDVFDVLSCEYGCNSGPALGSEAGLFQASHIMHQAKASLRRSQGKKLFRRFDRQLRLEDFYRQYHSEYQPEREPEAREIEAVYRQMGKFTPEQQAYDCGACGYDTCREMARAICLGYTVIDGCMESEKFQANRQQEKSERLASKLQQLSLEIQDVFRQLYGSIGQARDEARSINELNSACGDSMGSLAGSVGSLEEQSALIRQAMEDINDSVSRFAAMTNSIQNIAQQTNLLSLNASVEAARAGSVGKGFAVVAEEVRRLAMQSQETVSTAEANSERINTVTKHVGAIVERITGLAAALQEVSGQALASVGKTMASGQSIATAMDEVTVMAQQVSELLASTNEVTDGKGQLLAQNASSR